MRMHSWLAGLSGALLALSLLASGWLPIATVQAAASYPAGAIDAPAEGATQSGGITISGWAIDVASSVDTGVDRVEVFVDGQSRGIAIYAKARPDIAAGYGARFGPSGYMFLFDTSLVGGGAHAIEVKAHSSAAGTTATYRRGITVTGPPATATPTPNPAATATPTPSPAPPPQPVNFPKQFGVNAHIMWNTTNQAALNAERARAAGLQAVRFDIDWDKLEPSAKGNFSATYLSHLDTALDTVTSRGLTPLLVMINTPAWARGNAGTSYSPPTRVEDYGDTLAYLAARYASRPGLAFEVWNEPNQVAFWNAPGGPDALTYARMLKAAYPRIKTAAPNATVVGGSIAFNDQAYLQGLYAFGGIAGSYDALSLHPYSNGLPPDVHGDGYQSFVLAMQNTMQTMATYGEASKPIWITEMGWSTDQVSEGLRAAYFRRALDMVRGWPQVAMFMAYVEDQADNEPAVGLITPAGNPTPSWLAYSLAVSVPNSGASLMAGVIDVPQDWTSTSADVLVTGWAIDLGATAGPGVDRVQVFVDGAYRADATYGTNRGDLAAAYGAHFGHSGYAYQLAVAALTPGMHIVELKARSTVTGATSSFLRGILTVAAPTYPSGSLDSPAESQSVSGSVSVSGWALDMAAPNGSGVDRAQVFVDGVYVADATYGQPRPDIGAGYGARFTNSGFSYQLSVSGLAVGTHALEVRARSAATGRETAYRHSVQVAR
jgi:hypothetical protein